MARFYNFTIVGVETPELSKVVNFLNNSVRKDYFSIRILDALAEYLGWGFDFTVICDGDYRMTYSSTTFFIKEEEVSEWAAEIVNNILN